MVIRSADQNGYGHRPGGPTESDSYIIHPSARVLDECAGQLIKVLRRRAYLPRNSRT